MVCIVAAMPEWASVVGDPVEGVLDAADAIHRVDYRLAPGSETILLGYALDDIAHTGDPVGALRWWSEAYSLMDQAGGRPEVEETVVDLLLHGDLLGAYLALDLAPPSDTAS